PSSDTSMPRQGITHHPRGGMTTNRPPSTTQGEPAYHPPSTGRANERDHQHDHRRIQRDKQRPKAPCGIHSAANPNERAEGRDAKRKPPAPAFEVEGPGRRAPPKHAPEHTCIQHDRWPSLTIGAGEKGGQPKDQACQDQQRDSHVECCRTLRPFGSTLSFDEHVRSCRVYA